jgi:hypothetical protein
VRESASEHLPDRYAAELVPSLRFRTNTAVSGSTVRVTVAVMATGRGGSARQVGDLEDGDLRHPVFGRRRKSGRPNPWAHQRVKPNFVSEPMTEAAPAVRKEIEAAVDRVLTQITGG